MTRTFSDKDKDMRYIKVQEDIKDMWFNSNPYYFFIAMRLMVAASWASNGVIKRGELFFSFISYSEKLGIAKSTLQKFIKEAQKRGDISLRYYAGQTILSLHFYEKTIPLKSTPGTVKRYEGGNETVHLVPPNGTYNRNRKEYKKSDSKESPSQLEFEPKKTTAKMEPKKRGIRKSPKQNKGASTQSVKKPNKDVYELKCFWEKRWKWNCRLSWGDFSFIDRDWGMMKNYLAKFGMEEGKKYIEDYLSKDDPSLAAKGYPLGILLVEAQRFQQIEKQKKEEKEKDFINFIRIQKRNDPNSRRWEEYEHLLN